MYGLLIDTVGIQKYIFQSNHLQENLGASYIVKTLFNSLEIKLGEEKVTVGGGHCLITSLDSEDEVKKIIKDFSTEILKKYPGLTLSFAYIDDFDEQHFKESIKKLYDKLEQNRNKYIIHNIVPHSGITAECKRSGYTADVYYEDDKDFISNVSSAKLQMTDDVVKDFNKQFLGGTEYSFPTSFDKLGQNKGDSHIAVIHIDGNRMGAVLKNINTLEDYKQFSKKVSEATKNSFKQFANYIIDHYKVFSNILSDLKPKYLPIRPIVIGGDDITFVSEARVSFDLTEKLLEFFAENFKKLYEKPITASAGIMIMGTKYPFYRGYMAVEDLTDIAKKGYNIDNPKSFLSFDVAYSGFFGVNENTIKSYELSEFKQLKKSLGFLKKNWPHNKIKELRRVLASGDEEIQIFIRELTARKIPLPNDFNKDPFPYKKYQDLVTIIDLYPNELLKEA